MDIRLKVTLPTGTHEVTTNPWVIMLWERKFKTKASRIPDEGLGIEDLAFMAWESLKMTGTTVPISFDAFAQTVSGIEVVADEVDPARPTLAAPSDA